MIVEVVWVVITIRLMVIVIMTIMLIIIFSGESVAVLKVKGDAVFGSTVNQNGCMYICVTALGCDSTLAQIVKVTEMFDGGYDDNNGDAAADGFIVFDGDDDDYDDDGGCVFIVGRRCSDEQSSCASLC